MGQLEWEWRCWEAHENVDQGWAKAEARGVRGRLRRREWLSKEGFVSGDFSLSVGTRAVLLEAIFNSDWADLQRHLVPEYTCVVSVWL